MKTFKMYALQGICIVLGVFLLIVEAVVHPSRPRPVSEDYSYGWTLTDLGDNSTHYFEELPDYYSTSSGNEIVISKVLWGADQFEDKEGLPVCDSVGLFSFQQKVDIYLDDVLVMSHDGSENGFLKSRNPGNSWLFVKLRAEDAAKTLSIHIKACYGHGRVMIPPVYKGTYASITSGFLDGALPMTWLSLLGAFMGLFILILWLVARKTMGLGNGVPWLGMFLLFRGIWSAIETNSYSLFTSYTLAYSWISYISLKLCVVPFIMFDNITFHEGKSKFLNGLCVASIVECWVTCLLQFAGVLDFADTIFISHGIMLVFGVFAIGSVVKSFANERETLKEGDNEHKLARYNHYFFMMVIVVTSLIDMYCYYFTNGIDVARFSRIGYIAYAVAMLLALLLDYAKLVIIGRQAETIKEEASLDAMTMLYNRATFERDIDSTPQWQLKNMGVVMCDLNNLKRFNDDYGHDMGDYYIKISAEVIRDTFGKYGKLYRIGGDEFCGLVMGLSESEFVNCKAALEERIGSLKMPMLKIEMGIASGYCPFDEERDTSLRDTMSRADNYMYQRKKELKGENGVIRDSRPE